uniref:J domain-containing protein n=1 Tax=Panagrolaimus sp. PS1159 TaxID=55785 RepID=A0AC35FVR5_9BILA
MLSLKKLIWHPDRVENEKKDVATQKFPIISKAYNIINDPAKKKFYDSTGLLDDDWDKVRRSKEDAQRRCIMIFQQKMAQLK